MALNLQKAGHAVRAFDLSGGACEHASASGLKIAASAQTAVDGADVVISRLPASKHVESLFLGETGLLRSPGQALALGVAHGLDAKAPSQMMAVSTGCSWATEVCKPWPGVLENAPASRGYTGGLGNALMLKDLGLAVEAAMGIGATIPHPDDSVPIAQL